MITDNCHRTEATLNSSAVPAFSLHRLYFTLWHWRQFLLIDDPGPEICRKWLISAYDTDSAAEGRIGMSIRASIISLMMRHTIKKQLGAFDDVELLRAQMATGALVPKLPSQVIAEAVDAGGVPAEWVSWAGNDTTGVLLYFHGGGYVFGGPDSHRDLAGRLARQANLRVLVVDYRLAPEHEFPAAVDDALASYQWLLASDVSADNIVVAGDSAGGGLAASLLVNLRHQGLPEPAAAVLISPWVDLACTGQSLEFNAKSDAMLTLSALQKMSYHYLGGRDPTTPLASPLYADLNGLPPMLVIVGSTEVLLSDAERFIEKVNAAGGAAELSVWPKMPHVFPLFASRIPEGVQAITEISAFLRRCLSLPEQPST